MFRFLRYFGAGLMAATLLAVPYLISSATVNDQEVSVIVELNDAPGAVYKARLTNSGGSVSREQLQAYRNQLSAKQDEFLASLAGSGISATMMSRNIKAPDGSVAATVPLRYTLVLNGIALKTSKSSIAAIEAMSQVKKVHANDVLQPTLDKSVSYIGAPKLYGAVKHLGGDNNIAEGYEGYGKRMLFDT